MNSKADSNSHRNLGVDAGHGVNGQEAPAFLAGLPPDRLQVLDVRPLLERGQEPFQAIMQAVDRLAENQVLKLEAPFEPVPLYGVLARKGFQHWSRQNRGGAGEFWEIFFYRDLPEEEVEEADEEPKGAESETGAIREIDVRGLEPPEPLEQVLETLETMAYGEVLLVHHHRNPLILFDLLAERGYAYRSSEIEDDYWQVRIWRRS